MAEGVRASRPVDILLWLLRRRRRFRVAGTSMLPHLLPGDEVLVDPRAYRRLAPHPGDIVVAQHPQRQDLKLIKRVTAALDDNRFELRGDNAAASSDSRIFGAVRPEYILGRVVCHFGGGRKS